MAIIVQKFGGTSVATIEARKALLNQVKTCKDQGNDVVVVVSAMGRFGDPYATDTLISLLEEISPHVTPNKKDLIMSCGEIISCCVISHLLETNGITAIPLTGFQAGIRTNNVFGNSEIIDIDTSKIKKYLKDGIVPVIAGFQGITEKGEITTLGRGGSDTAAVAIGGYLEAQRVDIFTDVLGIAKVDPRIIPEAEYLESVTYDHMSILAREGAKVIHPRAVDTAQKFLIPVRVRSTFSEGLGTLITDKVIPHDHKIIGIAIQKELDTPLNKNINHPLGKIFILFHQDDEVQIQNDLQSYFVESKLVLQDYTLGKNYIRIILPSENIIQAVQDIYRYYYGVVHA